MSRRNVHSSKFRYTPASYCFHVLTHYFLRKCFNEKKIICLHLNYWRPSFLLPARRHPSTINCNYLTYKDIYREYLMQSGERIFWSMILTIGINLMIGKAHSLISLGATSIDKISEVRLSDEIGRGGWNFQKNQTTITIRYKILTFSLVEPFFKEGGGGLENFGQKLKFKGFFQLKSPLSLLNENKFLNPICFDDLTSMSQN